MGNPHTSAWFSRAEQTSRGSRREVGTVSNAMTPFSAVLGKSLRMAAQDDALAAKAARASKVKQMWRSVVEICCGASARAFLDHTNSVYIVREGEGDAQRKILIVYVDESIFAAELNARREMIKLKLLERFGEQIEEFRILISRGRYKENHPYRDSDEGAAVPTPPRRPLPAEEVERLREQASGIADERMREALLKAMISGLERKNDAED